MRLQGRAWERGYRGEPGNEATGESQGTRLERRAWEQGMQESISWCTRPYAHCMTS